MIPIEIGDPGFCWIPDFSRVRSKVVLARVKETLTLYRERIKSDETLGAAYYRGDRATRQLAWWKGYLCSIISDILADSDTLHNLFAEDDIYREMVSAMGYPGVAQRIKESRELMRTAD